MPAQPAPILALLLSGDIDQQRQAAELLLALPPPDAGLLWAAARPPPLPSGGLEMHWIDAIAALCVVLPRQPAEALLALLQVLLADATLEELALFWRHLRADLAADAFFEATGRPRQPLDDVDYREVSAGGAVMGVGTGTSSEEEAPAHIVLLDRFEIATLPVTRGQWARFDGPPVEGEAAALPAGEVSWLAAWLFAEWAGAALPTEAQWERACRAGTDRRWWWGDAPDPLPAVAWCAPHAQGLPHPVGRRAPNPLGLYDILGNVMEWCADPPRIYAPGRVRSPGEALQASPPPVRSALTRVVRGGYYGSPPEHCRPTRRPALQIFARFAGLGLRLVRPSSALEPAPADASDPLLAR